MYQQSTTLPTPPAKKQEPTTDDYVYFKVDKKMIKTKMAAVLYIESIKDYVKVRTDEKEIITQQKISYLEESLPASSSFGSIGHSLLTLTK
jgi:DNA-binding LytR/AlgR family response regulator